jgi:pyruvate formate-lyase activating enzyme-like uncharacterized protein
MAPDDDILFKKIGPLPEGCQHCHRGGKMVLLVTGLCARKCYYCPLSEKKRGKDVIYANEGRVKGIEGVLAEAEAMRATGTGITGGDPMHVPDRTLSFIKALKARFGKGHHIHMYTAGDFRTPWISRLQKAGLDEIRFHPPTGSWGRLAGTRMDANLRKAIDVGMVSGMELPAIPGMERDLEHVLDLLIDAGASFLNLNELELSETNRRAMHSRGIATKGELSEAALGSEAVAISLLRVHGARTRKAHLTLHYCSASYKDRVQLRKRMFRRARNVRRPFEVLTEDATFLKGIIVARAAGALDGIVKTLFRDFEVPHFLLKIDRARSRVEVAPWVLEEIAPLLPMECYIIEEYPTSDRLEVERRPLHSRRH